MKRLKLPYRKGDRVSIGTMIWFGFFWFLAGTFAMDMLYGASVNWFNTPAEDVVVNPSHTIMAAVATIAFLLLPLLIRPRWDK